MIKNELRTEGAVTFRGPRIGIFSIALVILILEIAALGFFWLYGKQLDKRQLKLDQKAANVDFEISKSDPGRLEALAYQARLHNLKILLNTHLYWSTVLSELEKSTYKLASYQSLQADQLSHKFSLTGSVASYTDLAKLMLGYETSPYVKNVTLITARSKQAETAGYQFTLDLIFDPKLLLK